MVDGETLGDDPAQRQAQHVRPLELELVQQLGHVSRVIGQGAGLAAGNGAAEAAVIGQDAGELLGEVGNDRVPDAAIAPEAGNEEHRVALADDLVVAPDVRQLRPRHDQPPLPHSRAAPAGFNPGRRGFGKRSWIVPGHSRSRCRLQRHDVGLVRAQPDITAGKRDGGHGGRKQPRSQLTRTQKKSDREIPIVCLKAS